MRNFFERVWLTVRFALKAGRHYWLHGDDVRLTVSPDSVGIGEGHAPRFSVEAKIGGHERVLYEGSSGAAVRNVIEKLRRAAHVDEWKAYRDGEPWDWGPRNGSET